MKLKLYIFLILIVFFTFLIYIENKDNKIYYVNIDSTNKGEYNNYIKTKLLENNKLEKYVNDFSSKDLRTTDLIEEIKTNKKQRQKTIQQVLIKADLITLNIGINDISYKIGKSTEQELINYTDEIFNDIEKLFKLLRVYSKEKIYIIKFNNSYGEYYNNYFEYANNKLEKISKKYNIKVIEENKLNDLLKKQKMI